jgi:acetoin utilization deacetylase AcuC-like enzyme
VLSIGFDTMKGDPTGDFVLSAAGLEAVGARLHRLDLPVLAVQEGGYALRNLKSGARRFFAGLLAPQRR